MVFLKRFLLMIQFLTAIPLPLRLEVENKDFGRGLVFAPVVGLIIGGILAGTFYLLGLIFPVYIAVIFIMIEYILLTGGLHLDGLGDTFDGLFSNRPKERMLEIMRDSRVGTNAVLAIVSVFMMNAALLCGIGTENLFKILLLMPVAGRVGSLVGAGASNYARSGEGLGKSFIDFCGVKEILLGLVFYSAIFHMVDNLRGLVICTFPIVSSFLLVKFFSRKIGGATGDILGAVCELNQTVFLIVAYIVLKYR